jgi:murein DD-endopeptidase MepM/ murein hydrolase activator NlpD
MPRPLFDSEYLFGLHEPGGEQMMLDAGRPGWVLFTEEVGRDPNNFSGKNFSPWSNRNLGVICRINHGYYPNGAIPNSAFYEDFARRCANYVANSPGCKIWIIGNEMNFDIERPTLISQSAPMSPAAASASSISTEPATDGALMTLVKSVLRTLSGGMGDAEFYTPPPPSIQELAAAENDPRMRGHPQRFSALRQPEATSRSLVAAASPQPVEVITPELYVRCYRLCRDAIRRIPGHGDDQVIVGAVAPWNNQTTYAGNPNGDWVQYMQDILRLLGANGCDGVALHTYTHGADPNLVHDAAKMNAPFQNRHYHFFAYRDFMNGIPADMRHLPVYITETDQDVPWLDQNSGWVQRAYGEIHWWNQQSGNQQIRALILYRWPNIDKWVIETKPGVIADFRAALTNDYRWKSQTTPPSGGFTAGQEIETLDVTNLRRTPGYANKPANDVLTQIPKSGRLTVLNSTSARTDSLTWWNVRFPRPGQTALDGWAAQTTPNGATLLRAVQPTPPPTGKFQIGDSVQTTTTVNLRRTPGFNNKPANDILLGLPAATLATVASGPRAVDGLTWWQIRGTASGAAFDGWAADTSQNGQELLRLAAPPSTPQPPTGKFKIGDTVITRTIVRMRRTPGITNKPANDVIADIAQGTTGTVVGGPQSADSLTWWQVNTTGPSSAVTGWMADTAPGGALLLEKTTAPVAPPPAQATFAIGELVTTTDTVRVRKTPGTNNKPADDVLTAFEPRTTLNLLEGPRTVDSLTWWRVGGITLSIGEVIGWVAEKAPGGSTLVARPVKLPGTNIPDRASGSYLGAPFAGVFGISQLWGENPQIYGTISYDGVKLKGHNGIDFMTPTSTAILAVADGVVEEAVRNDPSGFGHYVKLRHPWGESLYAHLESYSVQVGQSVRRGDTIARSNNTGFSYGPHLHFAIRINPYNRKDGWGGFSDPLPYMNPQHFQLPSYVRDATARVAAAPAPASLPGQKSLAEAPGYAPDKPGLVRP